MPLADDYRPKTWDDLAGNKAIRQTVRRVIERGHTKGYPVLLFIGPPGSGKTSLAKIVGNTIKNYHSKGGQGDPFTEMINSSDDRGIGPIRDLQRKLSYRGFATFVLDEGDNLTHDALEASRAILENKGKCKCIILTGNDPTQFTDAVKSRCLVFYFTPLTIDDITRRLEQIVLKEGIHVRTSLDFLSQISLIVNGDMRYAINELEKIINKDNTITDSSCRILFEDLYGSEYDENGDWT